MIRLLSPSRLFLTGVILLILLAVTPNTPPATIAQSSQPCDLTTVQAFLDRADRAYASGDYATAITDYTCAIELDPQSVWAINGRGNAYLALERYDEALADYNHALEIETGTQDYLYYNRGSAYLGMRDYAQAEADFNKALEINPEYSYAYNNRGNIYYDQGDYTRAIEDYDRAIEVSGDSDYIPMYNRGLAYAEIGNYDEALTSYDQAIRTNPDYAPSYLSRAEIYTLQNSPQAHADRLKWVELNELETVNSEITENIAEVIFPMTQGRVYQLEFRASGGQILNIAAHADSQFTLDPLIVVLDDKNQAVASDDDSGINLDATIQAFVVPGDGLYTLVLSHAGGGSEGDVELTLSLDGEQSRVFSIFSLVVGQPAQVYTTKGDKLNLREGPGLNFEILAKLEKHTQVTLVDGPRKEDGYVWWRVKTDDGQEGWAVERADEEQTLQPPLMVGGEAIVYPSSGDLLNVREAAGRSNPIVTQLAAGTVVTVLEGPVIADDLRWWKIRTHDGLEGWAVDEVDLEQTLIGQVAGVG